jgi:hypothetical protein
LNSCHILSINLIKQSIWPHWFTTRRRHLHLYTRSGQSSPGVSISKL